MKGNFSYKMTLDRVHCIGCSDCVAVCGKFFSMHPDGKAIIKKVKVEGIQETPIRKEDLDCALNAAKVCTPKVIHVYDIKKNKKIK